MYFSPGKSGFIYGSETETIGLAPGPKVMERFHHTGRRWIKKPRYVCQHSGDRINAQNVLAEILQWIEEFSHGEWNEEYAMSNSNFTRRGFEWPPLHIPFQPRFEV